MKYFLITITTILFAVTNLKAQSTLTATEKKINDVLCDCIAGKDLTKVKSREEASQLFTDCIGEQADLVMKLAEERNIDITNQAAMRNLGLEIGKNLLKEKCAAALKLGVIINSNKSAENAGQGTSEGTFKRIDLKGFNYIVVADETKNEKSFLWLKQFTGSEKFINATVSITGKKIKITWQEIEVYLPQAKGYYKVKEITAIDFL